MKMQIKKFSELTGVSVRTLHYYDQIGLLKPAYTDEQTGYRYYDECSLVRMQEILFFRELDFSLKHICEIISSPDYDREKALLQQKKLLVLKKERLERLIVAVDDAMKGEIVMGTLKNNAYEQYKDEVKERWGHTQAYAEYTQKNKGASKEKQNGMFEGMNHILGQFAVCMKSGYLPESKEAQDLVKELQTYITTNFYTCTNSILAGLGQMYVADERFKENIDKHAEGTAEFISGAIRKYCGTK